MNYIKGDKAIISTLSDLPSNIRVSAIRAAGRKAGKPIVQEARSYLKSKPATTNQEGQSKVAYIARNIKIVNSRNKVNPGVIITVTGKDFKVGNREWTIKGYGILLGEGSYHGKRKTRGTKANRGIFKGFGNYIQEGARVAGNEALDLFAEGIHIEVNKALKRAINRYKAK